MIKYQQGDVLLKEVKSYKIDFDADKGKIKSDLVLADGEATGHKHQIVSGAAQLILLNNQTLLRVFSDYAKLRHNTHNEIEIPKGDYLIEIVREYDDFEERKVLD